MRGAIPPLLDTPSWSGAQLKHRDNFTFTFKFTFTFTLGPNILLNTLFSYLSPCSSLKVRDQVSHP